MFEHAVRMHHGRDCGVASLATATGRTWGSIAWRALEATGDDVWADPRIPDRESMAHVLANLGCKRAPSGSSLLTARGSRGVVQCRVEYSEGHVSGKHWLAWARDEQGQVWCFDPQDGAVFRAASMSGRGFYALCHFTTKDG